MCDLILTEKPNKMCLLNAHSISGCWQQMQCMIEYTWYLFSITANSKKAALYNPENEALCV